MQLTIEYLTQQRQQMEQQRQSLLSHIQQVVGGIAMLDAMIGYLNEPEAASEPKKVTD